MRRGINSKGKVMDEFFKASMIVVDGLVKVMHPMVAKDTIPVNKAARLAAAEFERQTGIKPRWQAFVQRYYEKYPEEGPKQVEK